MMTSSHNIKYSVFVDVHSGSLENWACFAKISGRDSSIETVGRKKSRGVPYSFILNVLCRLKRTAGLPILGSISTC